MYKEILDFKEALLSLPPNHRRCLCKLTFMMEECIPQDADQQEQKVLYNYIQELLWFNLMLLMTQMVTEQSIMLTLLLDLIQLNSNLLGKQLMLKTIQLEFMPLKKLQLKMKMEKLMNLSLSNLLL